MKYAMVSVLYLIIYANTANSQIINGYGLKIGLTSSTQKFNSSDGSKNYLESNYRLGLNLGIFVELFNFRYFRLEPELYYNQKGVEDELISTRVDTSSINGYVEEKISIDNRIDYLTLGINGKFIKEFEHFIPYALAGLRYDLYLDKEIDKLYRDLYKKYDEDIIGGKIGLGIEITKFLYFPFLIECSYNHDFNEVKVKDNLHLRNISYEFKIGVKF